MALNLDCKISIDCPFYFILVSFCTLEESAFTAHFIAESAFNFCSVLKASKYKR